MIFYIVEKLKTKKPNVQNENFYLFPFNRLFAFFTIVALRTIPSRFVRLTGLLLNLVENSSRVNDVKLSERVQGSPSRGENSLSRVGF